MSGHQHVVSPAPFRSTPVYIPFDIQSLSLFAVIIYVEPEILGFFQAFPVERFRHCMCFAHGVHGTLGHSHTHIRARTRVGCRPKIHTVFLSNILSYTSVSHFARISALERCRCFVPTLVTEHFVAF